MADQQIERIINAKYDDYVTHIITQFKRLPDDCRQSGDDGLSDVWEEFKAQVQGEQSSSYCDYEETIRQFIDDLLEKMPAHEKELLWHGREESWFDDDDEDDEEVDTSRITDEVTDEIYRRVSNVATNETLATEEDELRIHAEDLKLLNEIRDLLATLLPRLEAESDNEECMQDALEDLSNLPVAPDGEWSVNIVQTAPQKSVWSVIADEDSVTVECRLGQGRRTDIKISWKLGARPRRIGTLAGWLAGASHAVADGASLELSFG